MKIEDTPCPRCNEKKLRVENRLVSRPLGSFSLSGRQMKTSTHSWPHLVCDGCGISAPAKQESVKRQFTWYMKVKKSIVAAEVNSSSPRIATMSDLGYEEVTGPATFDDGRTFVVIEKTKELEWTILDTRDGKVLDSLSLNKDAAFRYCAQLNDAEDRHR